MLSQAGKLRLAAARGDVGQVGELIRAKVPVTPDQEGRSAFHHAAACGHTQIVKMILDNQLSPVNQTDAGGKTALHLAAAAGHMQCTQVLISLGADVNHRERLNMNSPLHEAAFSGFSMTVDILCRAGFLLCGGSSPALPNTYALRRKKIIKLLLECGAELHHKNNQGETPVDVAKRKGHADVVDLLWQPSGNLQTGSLLTAAGSISTLPKASAAGGHYARHPYRAVAASYHQHLGNGGLRAQVTSQCTCHVRVTTGAEATVGQSRISHCILHGNREWHGGGDGGGFAVKVPAAAAADSGVPESLSYQQLFPISNPYQ
uniref:Ankyrin repeat domain-containing protein 54 n=1 Tax=Macrostomum lignano TaxID=282301 RepID=A0A1I8F6S0_9PLAT